MSERSSQATPVVSSPPLRWDEQRHRDSIAVAGRRGNKPASLVAAAHPWKCTTVFVELSSSSASRPFSRPCPLRLVPPNGSSTPPPAP